MNCTKAELSAAPDIMSKEDFRKLCHISKRSALYFMESGLIPATSTGKQTRCWRINKRDVIAFLKDRETNPEKYIVPSDSFGAHAQRIRVYPAGRCSKAAMEKYYRSKLAKYPDLLKTHDVTVFTGYSRQAVGHWVSNDHLKILTSTNSFHIPKEFLIEFLCSEYYDKLIRKSKEHMKALWEIHNESVKK